MRLTAIAGCVFLAALAGCAPRKAGEGPPDTRPERLPQATLDCIYTRAIVDWKAIDDYHIVVYAPAKSKAYMVELTSNCHHLMNTNRVRFRGGSDGRLCAFRNDAIEVDGLRCPIGAVKPHHEEAPGEAPPAAKP